MWGMHGGWASATASLKHLNPHFGSINAAKSFTLYKNIKFQNGWFVKLKKKIFLKIKMTYVY